LAIDLASQPRQPNRQARRAQASEQPKSGNPTLKNGHCGPTEPAKNQPLWRKTRQPPQPGETGNAKGKKQSRANPAKRRKSPKTEGGRGRWQDHTAQMDFAQTEMAGLSPMRARLAHAAAQGSILNEQNTKPHNHLPNGVR
jgi:hypothetical protein